MSFANLNYNLKCKVYSLSRNTPKNFLQKILKDDKNFKFIKANLNKKNNLQKLKKIKFDFIFHCATYGQPSYDERSDIYTNLNTTVLKFFDKSLRDNLSILFLALGYLWSHKYFKKPITENFTMIMFQHLVVLLMVQKD